LRLVAPVAESQHDAVHAHATLAENSESGVQSIRAEAMHSPRERVATRARRLVTTLAAPIIGIGLVALGSAAFWFTHPPQVARQDPLAGAEFIRLTDFVGAEEHAAISPDGRFMAFVSDRDGAWDVWVGQIGTGDFQNLTKGRLPELRNPAVRMLDFSPHGTHVLIWTKTTNAAGGAIDHGWTVPVIGGDLRPDTAGIAEMDWSPDGERIVYHPQRQATRYSSHALTREATAHKSTLHRLASIATSRSGHRTARRSISYRASCLTRWTSGESLRKTDSAQLARQFPDAAG